MNDKHLAVNLEHQVKQSRTIKALKSHTSWLRSSLWQISLAITPSSCPNCKKVSELVDKALSKKKKERK
jgi:hypothetical protein